MREREIMRKKRYEHEMRTIYKGNKCTVCGYGFMTGVICRKHRGNICERHCNGCEHNNAMFCRCQYTEIEPIDMRKWLVIHSHSNKDLLWQGIYKRELIRSDPEYVTSGRSSEVLIRAEDMVSKCLEPKYIISEHRDDNGDYALIDTDTGEIKPYAVKYLDLVDSWVCVQYVDPIEA